MIISSKSEDYFRKIFIIYFIFLVAVINTGIIISDKYLILISIFLQTALILFFIIRKYFIEVFIVSLFFGQILNWELRIYMSLLTAIFLIFFFITYHKDEDIFNNVKVPIYLKISSVLLIGSVFLSSILTPYFSVQTITYAIIFFIFLFSSYIIFKSISNNRKILKLLDFFVLITLLAGITKVISILRTGNIRAVGLSHYYYMEYAPIALLIIFFIYFVRGDVKPKIILVSIFIFLTMIADQSRFAWLGFVITLIYGLVISFIHSKETRNYVKNRFFILIFVFVVAIGLLFIFGLDKIIITRVSEINLELFQESEKTQEGQYISNSLESRVLIWITMYNTFLHHPFTGVGFLMFVDVSENYNVLPQIIYELYVSGLDAHTTYFNYLVDTGIIGLTLFLIFSIIVFSISFKAIKISNGINEKISIFLNILMFHMLFNSIYTGSYTLVPSAFFFYFIVALTVSNYVMLKKI